MMTAKCDLVIRGGLIVDDSGGPLRPGNSAVDAGIIVETGEISRVGRDEIDATGKILHPLHQAGQGVPAGWLVRGTRPAPQVAR